MDEWTVYRTVDVSINGWTKGPNAVDGWIDGWIEIKEKQIDGWMDMDSERLDEKNSAFW